MSQSRPPLGTANRIAHLERVAATDIGRHYKQHLLAALHLHPGHRVLDVGCGPGTDLPALATAVGKNGKVTGIDHDTAMLEQARRRTSAHPHIDVRAGDAHALPLDDASIDRARADRVLQHLADPPKAVAELHRILRAGGLIALAEPDWDTLAIDAADTTTSHAYTRYVVTDVIRKPTIGRRLGRLLHKAGFAVESIDATAVLFRDYNSAETILRMPAVAQRAWQAGALDEQSARAWLADLTDGPFLAAVTFFVAIGRARVSP